MRTIHISPAAVSHTLPLFASLIVLACAPLANASGPNNVPESAPVPFLSSFGLAQEGYPQTVSVSAPNKLDLSVTPEMLGDLMMIHQRYLAAIEAYQRAPHDSAVVWNKMGIAYQHLYALDFAKLQYEKALQLNPTYPEALNNLGTVYYGQQNYHKAEVYYEKALRLKPDCASFYSNLGTAYFADHNYKRGMQAYRKAFSLDPQVFISDPLERVAEMGPIEEQITLNYSLARLYAQAGMVDPAIHYLRMAYIDGFNDNKKLMQDPGFAVLRKSSQFRLFLTEEHIAAPDATEQSSLGRGKSPLR
ncbi:MAG TPA: tetratricopeptide repeat protein [Silvibacterium sp.]|nr:tetratricopeptide repeat protein [Silvibacterium sp.]